jgi:hypothetical protein
MSQTGLIHRFVTVVAFIALKSKFEDAQAAQPNWNFNMTNVKKKDVHSAWLNQRQRTAKQKLAMSREVSEDFELSLRVKAYHQRSPFALFI